MADRILIYLVLLLPISLQGQRICGSHLTHSTEYKVNIEPRTNSIRTDYSIPVVFHIVHKNFSERIARRRIYNQLDALNRDFNLRNYDVEQVENSFVENISSPNISFCLAQVTQNGQVLKGIRYQHTTIDNIGDVLSSSTHLVKYDSLGGSNAFDPEEILNVWICDMGEFLLGHSTFPNVAGESSDGIVLDYTNFTDDASNALGRTLVHEVGHYLGLCHLSGCGSGDCVDDDGFSDTPFQDTEYFGCPDLNSSSCGQKNMVQNFMSQSDEACILFFTEMQSRAMKNTLTNERKHFGPRELMLF